MQYFVFHQFWITFVFSSSNTLNFWVTLFSQTFQRCSIKLLNLLLLHLYSVLINWTLTFFMHNKYVLIFLLKFHLISFFPLCLKHRLQIHQSFLFWEGKKMYKTKTTEWHNQLKPTENELKMKIYLLILYLNHFNKNKLMFGRTLKKLFWSFLFLLRHSKVHLQTSTSILYKSTAPTNIDSAAFGYFFKKSAFCDTQICLFFGLRQHLRLPLLCNPQKLLFNDCLIKTLKRTVTKK